MGNPKTKTNYREGSLGWWLVSCGWEPVEQTACPRGGEHRKAPDGKCEKCREFAHPLWRFEGFDALKTAEEAQGLERLRIHNEFAANAKLPASSQTEAG